jgi:hypothetical protein
VSASACNLGDCGAVAVAEAGIARIGETVTDETFNELLCARHLATTTSPHYLTGLGRSFDGYVRVVRKLREQGQ